MNLADINASRRSSNRAGGQKSRLGRSLENLVATSTRGVHLVQIGRIARTLPGGQVVATKGPVDFFGCFYENNARLLVFDCKSTKETKRLPLSAKILKPHQLHQLISFGEAGCVSGILAECSTTRQLYWIDWRQLTIRRPSIPWEEATAIGPSTHAVDWNAVARAAYMDLWAGGTPTGFAKRRKDSDD